MPWVTLSSVAWKSDCDWIWAWLNALPLYIHTFSGNYSIATISRLSRLVSFQSRLRLCPVSACWNFASYLLKAIKKLTQYLTKCRARIRECSAFYNCHGCIVFRPIISKDQKGSEIISFRRKADPCTLPLSQYTQRSNAELVNSSQCNLCEPFDCNMVSNVTALFSKHF